MRIFYVKPEDPRLHGHAGYYDVFTIYIDKRYKEDKGLLEHELTHYRQFKDNPFFYHIRYNYSKKWRCRYEIEAYAKQVVYAPDKEHAFRTFAKFLSERYDLDISVNEAERRIRTFYFRRFA